MANAEALTWGYDDFLPSELHLPVNHEAIAKITAMDVLHNFYVPHMKVKMDAVPGMPTSFKFTYHHYRRNETDPESNPAWQRVREGDTDPVWMSFWYEVACAELCGLGHSAMKYTMVVESEDEYNTWAESQIPYWNGIASSLKISGFSKAAPVLKTAEPEAPAATDTTATVIAAQ